MAVHGAYRCGFCGMYIVAEKSEEVPNCCGGPTYLNAWNVETRKPHYAS